MSNEPTVREIVLWLRRSCVGQPAKGDPWPHRWLHASADALERQAAAIEHMSAAANIKDAEIERLKGLQKAAIDLINIQHEATLGL
jgi:hypothetical protein